MKVFIGYDPNETVALHVLANSIMRHAKSTVTITPLILRQLPMTREKTATQSTEFAFSRFLVPWLCNYQGKALFMDCDMLCRTDISELFDTEIRGAVGVVKHSYSPKSGNKFLGQAQSIYPKKNWSSVMLFNNQMCPVLTPEYVNTASGLELHQFKWCGEHMVDELPKEWNHLVGEFEPNPNAKIVHFTLGTPCFAKYADCEFSQQWRDEKALMTDYNKVGEYSRRAA